MISLVWLGVPNRKQVVGKRSSSTTESWRQQQVRGGTYLTMARLFFPFGFCAKCAQLTRPGSPLLTPRGAGARAKSVFLQQQKRYIGGTNTDFFRYRSKSRIWIWGVGVGVAVAVGLKYCTDTADSPCDDNTEKSSKTLRTDRYSGAIKVSRDLVERIKVGTEVGQETAHLGLAFTFVFLCPVICHLYEFSVCFLSGWGWSSRNGGWGLCGRCTSLVWRLVWLGAGSTLSLHGLTSMLVQFQDTWSNILFKETSTKVFKQWENGVKQLFYFKVNCI